MATAELSAPSIPIHPACNLFPLMDASALAKLADDIRDNGLLNPIVLHEGQIIDGRNRLLSCRIAGVEPTFIDWRNIYSGEMPLIRWIWSTNVERRHLTRDQITAVEVAMRAMEEREAARERQDQANRLTRTDEGKFSPVMINRSELDNSDPSPPLPRSERGSGTVRSRISKAIGVPERSVQRALNVQKASPELLTKVAHGEVTLLEAEREVRAEVPSKRQQMIENAAKNRLVTILSNIRGLCRGLPKIDPQAIHNTCTPEEIQTWADMAREQARILRQFSIVLAKEHKCE